MGNADPPSREGHSRFGGGACGVVSLSLIPHSAILLCELATRYVVPVAESGFFVIVIFIVIIIASQNEYDYDHDYEYEAKTGLPQQELRSTSPKSVRQPADRGRPFSVVALLRRMKRPPWESGVLVLGGSGTCVSEPGSFLAERRSVMAAKKGCCGSTPKKESKSGKCGAAKKKPCK